MTPKCYWFKDSIKRTNVEKNYWFLSEIGSSLVCFYRQNFYRTFQCMEKSTERIYFIKIITKLVIDPRTKMEVNKFLVLDHPNLVRIKEIYESEENVYVVTEVHSMNILDNFIEKKIFNERDVASAMRSVLKALVYLHGRKIFHRFINPENIVVVIENGELVVKLDNCFMGSLVPDDVQNTLASSNLIFTAPEMLRNRKEELAADLWSIGVVVYFLLSGELPFRTHSPRDTLATLFAAKLHLEKIPKLSLTTKDFIEHLVHPDIKKRMTAEEALAHPWIHEGLNSMVPLVGLSEKLYKNRKLMMIKVKTDVVNSSTYNQLLKRCRDSETTGCYIPSSICGPKIIKRKQNRMVIVTNEADFYFRFGPNAHVESSYHELNSSNVCRLLRSMYRQEEVTLYEEAVRCQAYYKSLFNFNEYIPSIWKLDQIITADDYYEWLEEMTQLKLKYDLLKRRISEEYKTITWEKIEEEEDEFEVEEFSVKDSELDKVPSTPETKESISESEQSKKDEVIDTALSSLESIVGLETFEEMEEEEEEDNLSPLLKELQMFAKYEHIFDILPEKSQFDYIRNEFSKQSLDFEPDMQLISEIRVIRPKKRDQKRQSALDFMIIVDKPTLFQRFFDVKSDEAELDLQENIKTVQILFDLYLYRPPFHPSQLGIDQFTVDQEPNNHKPFADKDIDPALQNPSYTYCRKGVITKKVTPPWLYDVDNPTPFLIPFSQFHNIINRGIPVPDTCFHIPPETFTLDNYTIHDLIDDPMLSRFNAFQHPYFTNSTPPRIQLTQRFFPYSGKQRHYRDTHCSTGDQLIKKCPYKKIMESRLARKATVNQEGKTDEKDKTIANESTQDFDTDGGELCRQLWSDSTPFDQTDKFENDHECSYFSGRPCNLEAFDTEGKICVISRDANRRLCCQNLYQLWSRIDRENELMIRDSAYKATMGSKIKRNEESFKKRKGFSNASTDADGKVLMQLGQDIKVTQNPNKNDDRKFLVLQESQNEKQMKTNCADLWNPFKFRETNRLLSIWSTTLLK